MPVTRTGGGGARLLGVAAAAIGAVMLTVAPAGAVQVVATYTGRVTSGFDEFGTFGLPDRLLDGQGVVVQFTFDSEVGFSYPAPGAYVLEGFELLGNNPMQSATITLNNRTIDLAPYMTAGTVQQFDEFDGGFPGRLDQVVHRVTSNGQGGIQATVENNYGPVDFLDTTDITAALDYLVPAEIRADGSFAGDFTDGAGTQHFFLASYDISRVTIAGAGVVPEPATWGLTILGFGLAGAALRRRVAASGCDFKQRRV